MNPLALDLALANLNAASGKQHPLKVRIVFKVGLGVFGLLAIQRAEYAQRLGYLFLDVVFGNVDHVRRGPVELDEVDHLWPCRGVIVETVFVGLDRHGRQDVAFLRVLLVLALGVQVEEHARVSVEDRLEHNALLFVFGVAFVLILVRETPRTEPAADRFLESVVVGLVCAAVLLICPVKLVAGVGQLQVGTPVLGDKINRNAIVAVL